MRFFIPEHYTLTIFSNSTLDSIKYHFIYTILNTYSLNRTVSTPPRSTWVHKGPVCGVSVSASAQAIKPAATQRLSTSRCLTVSSRCLQNVTIEAASHAVRCLQCRFRYGWVLWMQCVWSACYHNSKDALPHVWGPLLSVQLGSCTKQNKNLLKAPNYRLFISFHYPDQSHPRVQNDSAHHGVTAKDLWFHSCCGKK